MSYELGETAIISIVIKDSDETLTSPDTVTISIRAPDRTMSVTDAAMTEDATGLYHYDFDIPEEPTGIPGKYIFKIEATGVTGRVTIATGEISVVKSI
jgi:uncharacterized protein YfaS (alpha-2-macroglobulin family)